MQPIVVQGKEATLLDLRLFLALRQGPLAAAELARRLALRTDRAPELFDALAAEGLLERRGACYANAAEVDGLLEWADTAAAQPRLPLLLASLALAAGVALAALVLLPPSHRPATDAAAPVAAVAAAVAPATDPYAAYPDPVFYLVGSQRQAYLVNSGAYSGGIDFGGGPVVVSGSADEAVQARVAVPGSVTVDLIASPADEQATLALIENENAIRSVRGERKLYIVDLRPLLDPSAP
jgi:hypothetical protein